MLKLTSRYGTERVFKKITENLVEFQSFETLYYTVTGNDFSNPDAIDPDGGPFIYKGFTIPFETEKYRVGQITNVVHDSEKEYLQALLHVEKI
jgi:hypothetical protein